MAEEIAGNINATSLRFEWEIDKISVVRSQNVGECLESPRFTANFGTSNIQWHMCLYQKSLGAGCTRGYFVFFLYYDNPHSRERRHFKIINDKGENIGAYESICLVPWLARYIEGAQYVSRDFVENPVNGISRNDALKFTFELKFEEKIIKGVEAVNQQVEEDLLPRLEAIDQYEALLNDSKFSDMSLISEGKEIKVHKCILASRSPVFAAMFDAEMKEKQENIVEIADIKYDVLLEMIRFVYAGKVNDIDTLAGELAVAADKYALDKLKNKCEKTMAKNISLDNVNGCLQVAERLHMNELKEKSIEFIVENASNIVGKPQFNSLSHDIVRKAFCGLAMKNQK